MKGLPKGMLGRQVTHCSIAVVTVVAAFLLRQILLRYIGPGLPLYVFFYPAVMLVGILFGFWPGLLATAMAGLLVAYWYLPPAQHFGIQNTADAVGLAIFLVMGVSMSLVAELYRRSRRKAAAYEKEHALRESQEALANERANLQAIFDVANVGLLLIGEGGVVQRVNDTVSRWVGKALAAHPDARWGDFMGCIHALADPAGCGHTPYCASCPIRRAYESVLQSGQSVHDVETQSTLLVNGNEAHVWLEVSADPVVLDGKRCVILAMSNITERKQAEEALRASEEKLRLALAAAQMGTWEWDLLTGEVECSDECRALFPLNPDTTMTYDLFLRTLHPEDRERVAAAIREAWEQKREYDVEMRVPWPDGTVHWVLSQGRAFYDAAGKPLRMAGVALDITQRKGAELTLRDALVEAQRFREAVEHVSAYVYMKDSQFRYVYANRRTLELFGCSAEELVGCDDTRFFPAETVKRLREVDSRVFAGEQTSEEINVTHVGAGQRVYWEVKTPIYAEPERKTICGLLGISTDITERKLAEEALRKSEEQLRLAALAGEIGVWSWIPGTSQVTVSANWRRLFGVAPETEVTFETWRYALHPEDCELAVNELNAASEQHRDFNAEYRVVRPDGTVRWLVDRGRASYDKNGRAISMAGINVDITARKLAEEALRESEERYRSLFESMEEGFALCEMIYDPEGKPVDFRYLSVNPAFARLTGLPVERVVGRRVTEVIPGIEPYWIEAYGRVTQSARSERLDNLLAVLGRHFEVFAWRTGVGRFAAVFSDVTHRKQAEESLRRSAEDLSRSNQDLAQFAYVASHDLKEPLRMVSGFVEILSRRYANKLDTEADEYIHFIVEGVERMQQLIDDLLSYSRVERKGEELAPVGLQRALDRAKANLKTAIDQTGARITQDELPTVMGDLPQLAHLYQNLLSNALKFTRKGSTPEIHIGARRDDREWILWVKDNGIGISEQFHERIFKIFQRLHGRGEYPGTGIGLAICRKIVERHGGRIWVESKVDGGSSFCFTLRDAGK